MKKLFLITWIFLISLFVFSVAESKEINADIFQIGKLGSSTDAKFQVRDGADRPYIAFKKSTNEWVRSEDGIAEEPIAGGENVAVTTKSADYVILDDDGFRTILVDDTTVGRTITLPTAADNTNRIISIKNISVEKGSVTVEGEGAEEIDFALNKVLNFKKAYITIQCDGTGWSMVADNLTSFRKQYSLTVTGTNWTTLQAYGNYYEAEGNIPMMWIRIDGTLSVSTTNLTLTVANTPFAATVNQPFALYTNGSQEAKGVTNIGVNTIGSVASSTSISWRFTGLVQLNVKPSYVE